MTPEYYMDCSDTSLNLPSDFTNFLESHFLWERDPTELSAVELVGVPILLLPLAGQLSSKDCPTTRDELDAMSGIPCREVTGKLLYLSLATRPDISYAVGVLCRFNHNPGHNHWASVKQVHQGYMQSEALLLSTLWGIHLQPHVSILSTELEYTTRSAAGCELQWMRYFFEEIGYDITKPSTLWMDSGSAIQVAKNPEHTRTMKHVHRSNNWIRERVEAGDIAFGMSLAQGMLPIFLQNPLPVVFHNVQVLFQKTKR